MNKLLNKLNNFCEKNFPYHYKTLNGNGDGNNFVLFFPVDSRYVDVISSRATVLMKEYRLKDENEPNDTLLHAGRVIELADGTFGIDIHYPSASFELDPASLTSCFINAYNKHVVSDKTPKFIRPDLPDEVDDNEFKNSLVKERQDYIDEITLLQKRVDIIDELLDTYK